MTRLVSAPASFGKIIMRTKITVYKFSVIVCGSCCDAEEETCDHDRE